MRTTGDFSISEYTIKVEELNKPIYLIPFGDVHRSSPLCHVEKWLEFCEWAATKERALFLGMGDYDDLISTSERKIMLDSGLHESTTKNLFEMWLKSTERFASEISFMKGKLIGLLEGNHYAKFANNTTTTTQKLAELMSCSYLGCNSFIRLTIQDGTTTTGRSASVDIFAHHGRGGGRTIGGSMNPVQQMADIAEADIYLMGDNHQKGVDFKSRLRLSSGRKATLSHRKILLGRTGSYLRGYVDGEVSYIVDKNLPPSDLGVIKIELTPRRIYKNDEDRFIIDIHASI